MNDNILADIRWLNAHHPNTQVDGLAFRHGRVYIKQEQGWALHRGLVREEEE